MITRRRILDQVELSDHEKKNLQILDTIRKKGPIARAEISRLIGLNIVTVTSYVDQYIKKGVIKEVGIDVSSGGRKPTLVDLNPDTVRLVGVGLNAVGMIAILCDLKGEIIFSLKKKRPLTSGDAFIQAMLDLVGELLQKAKVDAGKVHGIGIGIPGIFNRDTNTIRWPYGLLKDDLEVTTSVHGVFEEKFGIPTFIDNDANAAVFGEEWYSKGLEQQHIIYLYGSYGCGILINGHIYHGATGSAGEWLFQDGEGKGGPLIQAYESGLWSMDLGITKSAQDAMRENPSSAIYQLSDHDANKIDFLMVIKAAESGDALAGRLLREAGERLGRKASFLVNLFNPSVLIIGGGAEIAGAPLVEGVRETVKKMAIPEATQKLRIMPSALGENGVPLGAAAFVAQNYFVTV